MHCSPDNARRQAQLRASPRPPSPCTRVRGIINTLETRVSSIGGCNNKRSGRPPMQVGGVKKWGGGGGVRANEGLTAVQTQSSTNKLRDKEQRQEQRQEQNRTRLVSCLVSAAYTHTRGVCVMCEKRSKKYTKKSIKKKRSITERQTRKKHALLRKTKTQRNAQKTASTCRTPLDPDPLPSLPTLTLHLLLFAFSQRS